MGLESSLCTGATGREDWDYAHCLPYFKRLEKSLAHGDSEFRGNDGPQILERAPADHPLFQAFFSAAQQAGYSLTPDINGAQQEGFAPFERMISRGRRFSAARAYVHPVKSRRNLDVRYRVLVTKIDFEGTRATGVTYRGTNGAEHRVRAAEVILCGGAFNSPQVLQLSGVGDADQLKALDIAPVQRGRQLGGPPRRPTAARLHPAHLDARHEEQARLAEDRPAMARGAPR